MTPHFYRNIRARVLLCVSLHFTYLGVGRKLLLGTIGAVVCLVSLAYRSEMLSHGVCVNLSECVLERHVILRVW